MLKYIINGITLVLTKPIYSIYLLKNMFYNRLIKYICKIYNLSLIFNHKNKFYVIMSGKGTIVEQELMRGKFENYLENFYENNLKKDSIFFDIGTNIGFFSLLGGNKITKGKIYSFDADINILNIFKKSILLNNYKNIEVHNNAISNYEGNIKFNLVNDPAFNSIGEVKDHGIIKSINVKSITLDYFIKTANIKKIDFIKIDVEGSELDVLKGGEYMLKTLKPILSIEVGEKNFSYFNYKTSDIIKYMKNLDYNIYNYRNNYLEKETIKSIYIYDNLIFIHNKYDIFNII